MNPLKERISVNIRTHLLPKKKGNNSSKIRNDPDQEKQKQRKQNNSELHLKDPTPEPRQERQTIRCLGSSASSLSSWKDREFTSQEMNAIMEIVCNLSYIMQIGAPNLQRRATTQCPGTPRPYRSCSCALSDPRVKTSMENPACNTTVSRSLLCWIQKLSLCQQTCNVLPSPNHTHYRLLEELYEDAFEDIMKEYFQNNENEKENDNTSINDNNNTTTYNLNNNNNNNNPNIHTNDDEIRKDQKKHEKLILKFLLGISVLISYTFCSKPSLSSDEFDLLAKADLVVFEFLARDSNDRRRNVYQTA